jgi:hypothetical protein
MKNSIILLAIIFTAFAFGKITSDERTATVKKIEGLHIYFESYPSDEYRVIGTVSANTESYLGKRSRFAHRAAMKYPEADGIYYDPDVTGKFDAQVIKFKD